VVWGRAPGDDGIGPPFDVQCVPWARRRLRRRALEEVIGTSEQRGCELPLCPGEGVGLVLAGDVQDVVRRVRQLGGLCARPGRQTRCSTSAGPKPTGGGIWLHRLPRGGWATTRVGRPPAGFCRQDGDAGGSQVVLCRAEFSQPVGSDLRSPGCHASLHESAGGKTLQDVTGRVEASVWIARA